MLNPQPDANANAIPPALPEAQIPPVAAAIHPAPIGGHLAAEHQAMVLGVGPVGDEPYNRPNFFPIRVETIFVI